MSIIIAAAANESAAPILQVVLTRLAWMHPRGWDKHEGSKQHASWWGFLCGLIMTGAHTSMSAYYTAYKGVFLVRPRTPASSIVIPVKGSGVVVSSISMPRCSTSYRFTKTAGGPSSAATTP